MSYHKIKVKGQIKRRKIIYFKNLNTTHGFFDTSNWGGVGEGEEQWISI